MASGAPDARILGTWQHDWIDYAETGRWIHPIGDLDGGGLPEFAVYSDTYREEFAHIFRGEDLAAMSSLEELDIDDAWMSLTNEGDGDNWSPLIYQMRAVRWHDEVHLLVATYDGYAHLIVPGPESTNQSHVVRSVRAEVYPSGGWRDAGVMEDGRPVQLDWRSSRVEVRDLGWDSELGVVGSLATLKVPNDQQPNMLYSGDFDGDGDGELLSIFQDPVDTGYAITGHIDHPFEQGEAYPVDAWNLIGDRELNTEIPMLVGDVDLYGDTDLDGKEEIILHSQYDLRIWHDLEDWNTMAPHVRFDLPEGVTDDGRLPYALGDINGDDYLDLVVTLPTPDEPNAGQVVLLLGPFPDGVIDLSEPGDGWLTGEHGAYTYGSEDHIGSRLGDDLAFIGDLNGDGCDELLIGEPGYELGGPEGHGPGAVQLFFGAEGAP